MVAANGAGHCRVPLGSARATVEGTGWHSVVRDRILTCSTGLEPAYTTRTGELTHHILTAVERELSRGVQCPRRAWPTAIEEMSSAERDCPPTQS